MPSNFGTALSKLTLNTQQAAELLDQREMTAQEKDLWQPCQTEVNGPPMGNAKNGRRAA